MSSHDVRIINSKFYLASHLLNPYTSDLNTTCTGTMFQMDIVLGEVLL